MKYVKPKKHLGQHFLKNLTIAQQIVDAMTGHGGYSSIVEIGPGTGVLTERLLRLEGKHITLIEIDAESVVYLKEELKFPPEDIMEKDFLKIWLEKELPNPVGIIGNLPYNISTQIFFKILESPDQVTEMVCMLQKEVAERIVAGPGGRVPGILSILLQAFYDIELLFKVGPQEFNPPPKVESAVISLKRNSRKELPCDRKLFTRIVKQGFNNRRKTLRNALKPLSFPDTITSLPLLDQRAEQLSVDDFIGLCLKIEQLSAGNL